MLSRTVRAVHAATGARRFARVGATRTYATFSKDAPKDLKYTQSHEWVRVQGNIGTVGITAEAARQLGDIVFVDLPDVKKQFKAKSSFGAVESVKAASDVYSPVSGEVVEVNNDLKENPANVNKAPYTDAWMIKVKLSNPAEVDALLSSEQYLDHCAKNAH